MGSWRGHYINKTTLQCVMSVLIGRRIRENWRGRIYSKSSVLPSNLHECYVWLFIHKGNSFRRLFLRDINSGYKYGEFAISRKPFYFVPKKKKQKKS